jgi:hypothetical protein
VTPHSGLVARTHNNRTAYELEVVFHGRLLYSDCMFVLEPGPEMIMDAVPSNDKYLPQGSESC